MSHSTSIIKFPLLAAVITLLCGLSLVSDAFAANITASVNRNPVLIDESFSLRLKADGNVDGDPELAPLEQDFDILGTSQSTSMNYVNGNISREIVWEIALISKRTGVLTIPSIAFGRDRSPALRITVNDAGDKQDTQANRGIFLEVETDTDSTWVQGQVVYSVRLFRNVGINNASLSPPETSDPDAIIEKLGDDVNYEAFRDGVRYDVIERRFAIFPQQSGTLKIAPTRFEGRIGRSRSLFDSVYSNDKIKRVRSDEVSVTVQPQPAGTGGDWLPAQQLSLTEQWSVPPEQLKAGEPVTRTLTIRASGVLANQIPEPAFDDIDGIKQYPDQPQSDNRVDRDGIEAIKQIKLAMIPTAGGRYTLPAIELPWWNTASGQREVARIPGQTIVVDGEATPVSAEQAPPEASSQQDPLPAQGTDDRSSAAETGEPGFWPWVSLVLAIAWLGTVVAWLSTRRSSKRRGTSLAALRRKLLQDCDNNDATACKQSLLDWAKARWPERRIHNLMDMLPLLDQDVANAIRELNSFLYSEHGGQWRGQRLGRLIAALPLKAESPRLAADPVEPLYRL